MQTQVNATTKFCRNGTRDECPIEKCRFQHARSTLLYSTAVKASLPQPTTTPTPLNTPIANSFPAKSCRYGTRINCPNEKCRFQHSEPALIQSNLDDRGLPLVHPAPNARTGVKSIPFDYRSIENLGQAPDGLACFRSWLEGQVAEQKAKIQTMCTQYSIPIPNLDSGEFSALPMIPSPMWNSFMINAAASNAHGGAIQGQPVVPPMPPAPRFPPAQPAPGSWQTQDALPIVRTTTSDLSSAGAPMPHNNQVDQASTPAAAVVSYPHAAPKKAQLAYKTTPCRHYTLNRGWCPWGDNCCFIHDPDLEWMSAPDRSSGRSTPSSTTLVGGRSAVPVKAFVESEADAPRSVSSRSAHCWGYIQGLCPHTDEGCKYVHPTDLLPYIKYTPCLTWPRCGYPAQACPLKHPQVDKLPMPAQQPDQQQQQLFTAPNATAVAPQPQTSVSRATTFADPPPLQQQQPPVPSAFAPAKEALIIPHDQAYVSAVRNHRPTAPSAEMFRPPPPTPIVRLRHPSGPGAPPTHRMVAAQGQETLTRVPRLDVYAGRARRVSIAVQRPDADLAAGTVSRLQANEFVKGHMRGKSLNV